MAPVERRVSAFSGVGIVGILREWCDDFDSSGLLPNGPEAADAPYVRAENLAGRVDHVAPGVRRGQRQSVKNARTCIALGQRSLKTMISRARTITHGGDLAAIGIASRLSHGAGGWRRRARIQYAPSQSWVIVQAFVQLRAYVSDIANFKEECEQ